MHPVEQQYFYGSKNSERRKLTSMMSQGVADLKLTIIQLPQLMRLTRSHMHRPTGKRSSPGLIEAWFGKF